MKRDVDNFFDGLYDEQSKEEKGIGAIQKCLWINQNGEEYTVLLTEYAQNSGLFWLFVVGQSYKLFIKVFPTYVKCLLF